MRREEALIGPEYFKRLPYSKIEKENTIERKRNDQGEVRTPPTLLDIKQQDIEELYNKIQRKCFFLLVSKNLQLV